MKRDKEIQEAKNAAFEEAAAHLEDHAKGYEHAAEKSRELLRSGPQPTTIFENIRQNDALAACLREKAIQLRLMKKEV